MIDDLLTKGCFYDCCLYGAIYVDGGTKMYIYHNENPNGANLGDCTIRAIALVTNQSWDDTYVDLAVLGFGFKDMPSSNHVWASYLKSKGFRRMAIPDSCPNCYTVADFCNDHQNGMYILATGSHVVGVIAGDYYDTWDSGREVPIFYFEKGRR